MVVRELPMPDAGAFAYVALFLWPIVIMILFRKLPLQSAVIWSILGGYLLLPAAWVVHVDLPLVPTLHKNAIPALMAAVMAAVVLRRIEKSEQMLRGSRAVKRDRQAVLPGWLPRSWLGLGLFLALLGSVVMSVLTNMEVLTYGLHTIEAMRPFDIVSRTLAVLLMIIPILLGRKFLANEAGHRQLLKAMVLAAVVYSVLALYEVRMSPQLNIMVYGFFAHAFEQHVRSDGFRPLVFLNHALTLAIFLSTCILAAAAMARMSKGTVRIRYIAAIVFMLGVLVLSKSLGAFLITMVLLPVVLFMPIRLQLMAAAGIAVISLSYPMVRSSGLIQTEALTQVVAAQFGEDRARSLGFRFFHEDNLLEKASQRPVFGWGGYTRWRVHDEEGNDITVSDGAWIITLSQRGWLGYISEFGFLTLPIMLLFLRRKRYDVTLATSGLCVLIAANLIDLIPNDSLSPLLWLSAGALLGRLELKRDTVASAAPAEAPAEAETGRRTRPGAPAPGLVTAMATEEPGMSPYSRFPQVKRRET
jgi:hypothetical protein